MRTHFIQHVRFEDPAGILDWCAANDCPITGTRLFDGDPLPAIDDYNLLIVMGGPMGVGDEAEYPWLIEEKRHIREAIDRGKKVLGICLGAQLIAEALGASVAPGEHREIGWFDVRTSLDAANDPFFGGLPEQFMAFHWHGDRFEIPQGAVHLARSAACDNQAFDYDGRVLGLQFHVESTPASVQRLIDHCADEIIDAPFIHRPDQMTGPAATDHFDAISPIITHIMNRFAAV